jgi:hypothetical protein
MPSESFYGKRLARRLNGLTEVVTPFGLIDVLTDKQVIEVKEARFWKSALGQVLAYGSFYPERQKRIHLIGKPSDEVVSFCVTLMIVLTWEPKEQDPGILERLEEEAETNGVKQLIKRSRQASEEGFDPDLEIEKVNRHFKLTGVKVALERQGRKLYVRGTFPPKPRSGRIKNYQQKISLKVTANLMGIELAQNKAVELWHKLSTNTFDWREFI